MRHPLGLAALSTLLLAMAGSDYGGWSVVTLRQLPEYLRVDEPTSFAFRVRQHGLALRGDLHPSITARRGNAGFLAKLLRRGRVRASMGSDGSLYEATLTPTDTGMISLSVDTDLYGWTIQLLPMRVVPAGETPVPLSPVQRGRQLFAAKGCATCHAMRDDPAFADYQVITVGPPLMGRSYPDAWLAEKLADPSRFRGTPAGYGVMPRLELSEREIAALVRYVNRNEVATDR